jgi:hypothetical protein
MFKIYAEYGDKKSKKTAAPKSKGHQTGKKRENQNPHEKTSKPNISTLPEAPHEKKSKKIKASDEKGAHIPVKSTKDKAAKVIPAVKNHSPRKVTGDDIAAFVSSSDPISFVRQRISKDFDGTTFFGTIMKYDDTDEPAFWHVVYDDGDDEDYNKKDLVKALRHYNINGKYDTANGHSNSDR